MRSIQALLFTSSVDIQCRLSRECIIVLYIQHCSRIVSQYVAHKAHTQRHVVPFVGINTTLGILSEWEGCISQVTRMSWQDNAARADITGSWQPQNFPRLAECLGFADSDLSWAMESYLSDQDSVALGFLPRAINKSVNVMGGRCRGYNCT